ncbi:cysteine sulfinic acid decarboxylase-like [Anneissia japonica]|uniref:cysteine sulfinic acid decarboxylase-like n=1 Tax=Anneissia japonica TaxID=1529436 RepID=UPI0014259793|nr:cysteine sulfinic acid decarboxylase-like [Anneissia japonica]
MSIRNLMSLRTVVSIEPQLKRTVNSINTVVRTMSSFPKSQDMQNGNEVNGIHRENLPADQQFFCKAFELVFKEGVLDATKRDAKVVEFYDPDTLKNLADLTIRDDGESDEKVLEHCRSAFKYAVKPASPHFFNQLFAGQDLYGLAGQWLTDAINASQYTFEVAPLFTLIEHEVFAKFRELCGYKSGDGIFCPGGSLANMYALNLARYKKFPQSKEKGMYGCPRLAVFTSEQSHYSLKKGAFFLGLGLESLKIVKCDDSGKMIPGELEKAIKKAEEEVNCFINIIFFIKIDRYDPLDEIADICEKRDLWLHVDAAWGGAALLSSKYKHLLKGVERTNSLTWCQHKMMGVPLQCSAFVLNGNEGLLHRAHSAGARYLFQQDKFYDMSYDTGDKSIQCGRKVDAFKIWLMWKKKGNKGFEAEINHKFNNSRYMANVIKSRKDFILVLEPECTNVCFWYLPPCLQGLERTPEFWDRMRKVAPIIKERMVRNGSLLIGYQPLEPRVNFFRQIFANAQTSKEDVDYIINEIATLGEDLQV